MPVKKKISVKKQLFMAIDRDNDCIRGPFNTQAEAKSEAEGDFDCHENDVIIVKIVAKSKADRSAIWLKP